MKNLTILFVLILSGFTFACSESGKRIENADSVAEMATNDTAVLYRDEAVWENIDFDAPVVNVPDLAGSDVTVRGNDSVTIYQASQDILFDVDKAEIKESGKASLQKIAANIKERTQGEGMIRVFGFTDSTASKEYNMELGKERAKAVEDWMTSNAGFEGDRIKVISKGQQDPIATNKTAEGRQQNRRVEIVVLKGQAND
ncbi:OmpA family protein [Rufibacter tibetensis]|uniref:OmpA family protein n=1 Tax=Rufibacter tibetensis TaxID=512763 RepID=UPI000784AB8D|nr:OmpA family protein [Rufibacter tibetensis]